MALSSTELANLRRDSGDIMSPFLLEYDDMQAFYDQTGDYEETVVKCVRLMLDRLTMQRYRIGDKAGQEQLDGRIKWLKEKLAFWIQQAGLEGQALEVGAVSFGLDETSDDLLDDDL